jgi:filamentous hemagglutinin family protein
MLTGVSVIALLAARPSAFAEPVGFYRPPTSASAAAAAAASQAATQAAQNAARQAQASLAAAARALQSAQQAQNIARSTFVLNMPTNLGADPRNPGKLLPNVPDGLAPGGLVPDPGIASDPTRWQNALAPKEELNDGRTTVSIRQTAKKAILNWQTFNVGAKTTVNFLQGDTDWSVLNRVTSNGLAGQASPSQILGQINAPGTVLLINQNGIIFGGGSQVNVHSLIASALDVGDRTMTRQARDQFFLNVGIAAGVSDSLGNLLPSFSSTLNPASPAVDGDVVVQKGATITTTEVGNDDPGFVYLFGPNVSNFGTITSPSGQVALVAGQSITLTPNLYDPLRNAPTPLEQTDFGYALRGTGFYVSPYPTIRSNGTTVDTQFRAGTGTVINDGLIATPRGITILNGDQVTMSGVISADTSILRNSQVFLDAVTRLDLSGTISILPFANEETLPLAGSTGSSSVTSFIPPFVEMSGFQTNLQPGALISAPGAAVTANGLLAFARTPNNSLLGSDPKPQINMMAGATIDVAGLQNVELPASYNILPFEPRGTEFADMPLQRNGALFGQTLYIDIRNTGTRGDGTTWIGTPLADATDFVSSTVVHKIDQLLTTGGTVTFKQVLANGSAVNIQSDALINVGGGSVKFLPGSVPSTQLVGVDGRIYDISKADPNIAYRGFLGHFVVGHDKWGVTETYVRFGAGQTNQSGYIDGSDAGGVSVQAVNSVLDGTMLFGAPVGALQKAPGRIPSQGSLSLTTPQRVVVADVASDAIPTSANLPTINSAPVVLSGEKYSSYGLSNLDITANDFYLPANASLTLAAGGTFSVTTAGAIDIQGSVTAHGGEISLTTDSFDLPKRGSDFKSITKSGHADIFIGGTLDASGRWINETRVPANDLVGPAFVSGGKITLSTKTAQTATGNILLSETSLLDVSSGGYVDQEGALKLSVLDKDIIGGDIRLATFQGKAFDPQGGQGPAPPQSVTDVRVGITLAGEMRGYGFAGGGSLIIETPSFQIGGQTPADPKTLHLSPAFFSKGGFASYTLKSPDNAINASQYVPLANSITLAVNTTVALTQQNFARTGNYTSIPTEAKLSGVAALATLPLDQRQPVNLTLASGDILLDTGSAIVTDPGASINIAVSHERPYGLLMRGAIVDHGGSLVVQAPYVWLGSGANLNFSGTFIANSTFSQTAGASQSGYLLSGGTVVFDGAAPIGTGAPTGFVIAETGATIDVSGASADIRVRTGPQGRPDAGVFADVPSWSDGGTIAFNTGSFLWDGSFRAEAGAPQGNRGTFLLGGGKVAIQASNSKVANGNVGIDVAQSIRALIAKSATPQLVASLGNLTNSLLDLAVADRLIGFDTVYLYSGSYGATRGLGFFAAQTPYPAGANPTAPVIVRSPLSIYGNVDLQVVNRLFLEGSSIESLTPGASITLSAPYVMLAGQQSDPRNPRTDPNSLPSGGTSSVTIAGQTIDVQSAVFRGFSDVSFVAQGDIRLTSPPVNDGIQPAGNQTTFFGGIFSGGDISFRAQRVFPVSAVEFEIVSTSSVRFEGQPGVTESDIPFSVGGSLTVAAPTIVQNGNIFAPLGRLSFGTIAGSDLSPNDLFAPLFSGLTTLSLTLGPQSITSVTLAGQVLPYGQTQDGTNWFYNSDTAPLATLPAKSVLLIGGNVAVDKNATVDERGGGELFAFEFVQGKGGTRDVLSNLDPTGPKTRPTYNPQTVYAIIPSASGRQPAVGAFDIHFNSYLGDPSPRAGQQVYLEGAQGLPAGWYTLYPAHYATMPGAYRLVDLGSGLTRSALAGATLPDGTQIVGGKISQSNISKQSSGRELFALQSGSVWRQYTEVQALTANAYFAKKAADGGRLPIDGGRLSIVAPLALALEATVRAAAAPGGRGGELDIAALAIDVIEPGARALPGHLGVDITQLNNSGFDSILIGGRRTDQADGTLIASAAYDVQVHLDATALQAGEIILAAAPLMAQSQIPVTGPTLPPGLTLPIVAGVEGTGTVTVAAGSVITTTDDTDDIGASGRHYLLGSATSLTDYAAFLGGTYNANTGAIDNVVYNPGVTEARLGVYASLSGAGGLLLVSNDPSAAVTRRNAAPLQVNFSSPVASLVLPAPGSVTIEAGARIGNGAVPADRQPQSVIVSATGENKAIDIRPGARIGAHALTLAAATIAVGDNIPRKTALAISPDLLAQVGAVHSLTLRTIAGNIDFYSFNGGSIVFNAAKTVQNLTLDASSLVGHGQYVAIGSAQTLTLVNSRGGVQSSAAAIGDQLVLDVGTGAGDGTLVLGGGNMSIAGFGSTIWVADGRITIAGPGTFAAGADPNNPVDLTIITPNLLVGGASAGGNGARFSLTTFGDFVLRGNATIPAATDQFGGHLQITAASVLLDQATIQAPSGIVSLQATAGDLVLGHNSRIEAPGYAQTFFDVIKYGPGGQLTLTSDTGNVITAASSVINLSQPDGGLGSGGSLKVVALKGNASLAGSISARGAPGRGGLFALDTLGGLDGDTLDPLAASLTAGGFSGEIKIHTRTGGMRLSAGHTLMAQTIELTQDDVTRTITIDEGATLDASGAADGTISLYGHYIDLSGTLLARANDPTQSGGSITIGISVIATVDSNGKVLTDPTYGFQQVDSSFAGGGLLAFGRNARLDVTGGSADGSRNGAINVRFPLTTARSVNVTSAMIDPRSQIVGARNLTIEAYAVWSTTDGTTGARHFDGFIDPRGIVTSAGAATSGNTDHIGFYQTTLVNFVQNVTNPAIDPAFAGAVAAFAWPNGTAVHLRPGIELRNPSTAVNNGDITVASNWNLAAASLSNLQRSPIINPATNTSFQYFDPATSIVDFVYRYGREPGNLTLRAIRDINVNASISDGFLHDQNFNNTAYLNAVVANTNPWSALLPAPVPDDYATPQISWAENTNKSLAAFDLFPANLNVVNKLTGTTERVAPDSWSYRLTTGADFGSANPNAVGSLATYGDTVTTGLGGHGDVRIDGHTFFTSTAQVALPTIIRTGTGSIAIHAARNVVLADRVAPGVIYTAGRNTELLPDPNFSRNLDSNGIPIGFNPKGFIEPNIIAFFNGALRTGGAVAELGKLTGPPTAPSFPELAGDISIFAQQDIIGWQNVTVLNSQLPLYQFYAPWLLVQYAGNSGAGAFAYNPAANGFNINPQTAWWIQFGRFGQGVLSTGGNVTVEAGRDMRDFSVSLPTTGRVSGGLIAGDLPVTHLYGSGNLSVRVGRNLYSGSFYEGSGTARISVGGSVASDWVGRSANPDNPTPNMATVLAVDTGQLELTAGGSIAIGNIINPAEIQRFALGASTTIAMTTYGPSSAIRLNSLNAGVTISTSATLNNLSFNSTDALKYTQTYPSILELTAFNGGITTPQAGMVLNDSLTTTLKLLAKNGIDLRGGVTPGLDRAGELIPFGPINTGASLIDLAFNAYAPNMGRNAFSTPVLAHADDGPDNLYDHIYALTGDVKGAGIIQIPRPVLVQAGRDIADLNLTAQNIRVSDVSEVVAGRDLYYSGLAQGGGLQIAGPGFFLVEAGRDLGPFLPAAADVSTGANAITTQQGIVSSGNAALFKSLRRFPGAASSVTTLLPFPVGNFPINVGALRAPGYEIGLRKAQFVGADDANRNPIGLRNPLLPKQGATIVARFGVGSGVNYDAVRDRYVDPANAASVPQNYLSLLQSFMASVGIATNGPEDAWAKWDNLGPRLQHIFIERVFFSELNAVTGDTQAQRGYQIINTMFPPDAPYGYTRNNTSGGANGAPKDQLVETGDLDMLHATIQSAQGGDILILGPGGQLTVGSVATEPNTNLKLNNLGILTLAGGSINVFTDRSVLVNSSRVLTEFGGDILMWSSNGDLDAGRGARTTVSLNALQVDIDSDDYQTVDPGGFVTGAGIGTLKSSSKAKEGSAKLLAPNGKIDAGDAGIRVSGNLVIVAPVVVNADFIKVGGSTTGLPTVAVPSIGGLTTAANVTSSGTRPADAIPTGSTGGGEKASIIIVEVLGYGGGGGGGGDGEQSAPTGSVPESEDERKKRDQ